MKKIAIITARGGSKRIPYKNIKEFCGKPIIGYSIETTLKSGVFDEVMVSTDDEKIKEIALKYGAKVPFVRSAETSDDYATTYDVLKEVLENYEKLGQHFEYMCCIYPTAPFITVKKITDTMDILINKNVDAVVPVVAFSFPPQRGFVINENKLEFKYPQYAQSRSQDLESMYHDAGQFYCLNTNSFLEQKKIIMDRTFPFILKELEVQDIDNETDWNIAELKYKIMSNINC